MTLEENLNTIQKKMATCKNDDRPPDQKSKFFIETKEVGLSARRKTLTSIYIITEYIPDIKFIIS